MTAGRLSRLHEFTPVPSHSSIFVQFTTKCHAGASHAGASQAGVSSPPLLYLGEDFTPGRNLATALCKRETTTRSGVKSVCR